MTPGQAAIWLSGAGVLVTGSPAFAVMAFVDTCIHARGEGGLA